MSGSPALESLLAVQERDLALDRLAQRRATLVERDAVARGDAEHASLATRLQAIRAQRDEVASEEHRLDHEARSLAAKAKAVDTKMYSGEISSPRELQAMQADIEQLQRHQREVENRELEFMEQREPLDAELVVLDARYGALMAELEAARAALAAAERAIDAEMAAERDARGAIAVGLDPALIADYERCRAKVHGVGAARLVGNLCQGCHLSIPSTEVERIRRADGTVEHCDNCGCILVP